MVFISLFVFSILGLVWNLNEKLETQIKLDRIKDNILHLKTARVLRDLKCFQTELELFARENALMSVEKGTITKERYLVFSRNLSDLSQQFYTSHQNLIDEIAKNSSDKVEKRRSILDVIKGIFDPSNDKICPNPQKLEKEDAKSEMLYDMADFCSKDVFYGLCGQEEASTKQTPKEAVKCDKKREEIEKNKEFPNSEALEPEIIELAEAPEVIEFSEIKKVDSKTDELEGILFPRIRSYKWIMGNGGVRETDGISRKQKLYDYIVKTIELNGGRVKGEVVIAYLLLKAFGVKKIDEVKNDADLNDIKYEFDNLKSAAYFGTKKFRKDDFNILHEKSGLGVEKEEGEPSYVIRKVKHCVYLNKAELFARDARKEVGE